jgi:hypothetical protein
MRACVQAGRQAGRQAGGQVCTDACTHECTRGPAGWPGTCKNARACTGLLVVEKQEPTQILHLQLKQHHKIHNNRCACFALSLDNENCYLCWVLPVLPCMLVEISKTYQWFLIGVCACLRLLWYAPGLCCSFAPCCMLVCRSACIPLAVSLHVHMCGLPSYIHMYAPVPACSWCWPS